MREITMDEIVVFIKTAMSRGYKVIGNNEPNFIKVYHPTKDYYMCFNSLCNQNKDNIIHIWCDCNEGNVIRISNKEALIFQQLIEDVKEYENIQIANIFDTFFLGENVTPDINNLDDED